MKNRKGTWPQALIAFFFPVLLILAVRWAVIEPFVIPSSSMVPNLLIHDHVFVRKFAYGLRLPGAEQWLWQWSPPRAGHVVVFRYPRNPSVFYVKRLIGLPGDRIRLKSGRLSVNGVDWPLTPRAEEDDEGADFKRFDETLPDGTSHVVRYRPETVASDLDQEWIVPDGKFFFMGDNRDQSSDSRVWGFVPDENLIGPAWIVWLSCDEMLESAKFLCHPGHLRWSRFLQRVR